MQGSQLGQDKWVMERVAGPGYFVDIGAYDGVQLSNTLLLEYDGWNGICVEPNPALLEELVKNRNCFYDIRCVWPTSGQFVEFDVHRNPTLSGVVETFHPDYIREAEQTIRIETVSLLDLLKQHKAPATIDYLSIDTEGSEFRILQAFDFNAYNIRLITVEHNHVKRQRELIKDLLERNGYRFSQELQWDDCYERV